jgi:hypothetical protein
LDFSQQIGRAAEDADSCTRYMDAHCQIGDWLDDRGFISVLAWKHDSVFAAVSGMLNHLSETLRQSQAALMDAGERYRETDSGSAASIDASYPAVSRPSLARARD